MFTKVKTSVQTALHYRRWSFGSHRHAEIEFVDAAEEMHPKYKHRFGRVGAVSLINSRYPPRRRNKRTASCIFCFLRLFAWGCTLWQVQFTRSAFALLQLQRSESECICVTCTPLQPTTPSTRSCLFFFFFASVCVCVFSLCCCFCFLSSNYIRPEPHCHYRQTRILPAHPSPPNRTYCCGIQGRKSLH